MGLNSDESVKALKGEDRPFQKAEERAEILGHLKMVDYSFIFHETTPLKVIQAIGPDVLVKGGDWEVSDIVGSEFVLSKGGEVKSLSFVEGRSTTRLVDQVRGEPPMKVLVVGKGGREHALGKALHESPSVEKVWAIPGSQGMEPEIEVCGGSDEFSHVLATCEKHHIDLVVVGPEAPLVVGLADQLRAEGILVFGPDQRGACLEGSKLFSKEFMTKYQVPTAPYEILSSVTGVKEVMDRFTPPYVLKADGLAGGKGVFICPTRRGASSSGPRAF